MNLTRPLTIGSLFSGIDGLALGVQMGTGGRVVWNCEVDSAADQVLAHHWSCPNLGDIREVDWGTVEPIDILVGGFPCQDISAAGKRDGIHGQKSGLWKEFVRAIRHLRPRYIFIENVRTLLGRGFAVVAEDLAACGYDAVWSVYSSEAVGAPHGRQRIFILASYPDGGGQPCDPQGRDSGRELGGQAWSNADGCRPYGAGEVRKRRQSMGASSGRKRTAAIRLNPDFVEWMLGFPVGWTASVPHRARLRLLGNSVQPQVAMAAWEGLKKRLDAATGRV